jgi:hypothetical protein
MRFASRRRQVVLAAITLAASMAAGAHAAPAVAQTQSLVGDWRGAYHGVNFRLVVEQGGAYAQTERMSRAVTAQRGVIQIAGPDTIIFVVQDWAPKMQNIYHPSGMTGGFWATGPVDKPPGGTYRVTFNSPNSITLKDVNLGGVITFQRAP